MLLDMAFQSEVLDVWNNLPASVVDKIIKSEFENNANAVDLHCVCTSHLQIFFECT
jgi:hypothetical protein